MVAKRLVGEPPTSLGVKAMQALITQQVHAWELWVEVEVEREASGVKESTSQEA